MLSLVTSLPTSNAWLTLNPFCVPGNTIIVNPDAPESHREVVLVPFQDLSDNGVLNNGFGIEIHGADMDLFRAGSYRAWLRNGNEMVVSFPASRNSFLSPEGIASYQAQRQRIGGHSDTYEVARMVVRNRIMSNRDRQLYYLLIRFPEEYTLTNAVITPARAPFGECDPQITPLESPAHLENNRVVNGLAVDIAFRVTIVEDEPRRAVAGVADNAHAQMLDDAINGMNFGVAGGGNNGMNFG